MRIGDKVRLLRGTEEGIIVSIKGNIVEVEIEDGFTIPAVKSEIVLIDSKEAESFDTESLEAPKAAYKQQKQSNIAAGLYLGIDGADASLDCYFVNHTEDHVLYSISIEEKKNVLAFALGICAPFDSKEAGKTAMNPQKGEIKLQLQAIVHAEKSRVRKLPIESNLTIQKNQLKDKVQVQTIGRSLALFNLEETNSIRISAEEIKEKMLSGSASKIEMKEPSKNHRTQVIDLHVDPEDIKIRDNEVLGYQLILFEKAFDQALQMNAPQLKVIHGIGSGKLRTEIHKMLSRRKEVNYFEHGDKERFGFGSTIIYF
jgi:dsDNA-specific endonuclease/ATPase MutS2